MNDEYKCATLYYGLRRRPGPFGTNYRVYGHGDVNPFTELEVIQAYLNDFHLPEIGIIGKSEIMAALFGILTYGVRTDKPFNMEIWNDSHLNPSTIEEEMRGIYSKFEIIYNHPNQAFLWPESPQVIFNDEGKPKKAIRGSNNEVMGKGTWHDFWRQGKQQGIEVLFISGDDNPLAIANFHFTVLEYDHVPTGILVKEGIYVHPDHQHQGIGTWVNNITNGAMESIFVLLKKKIPIYWYAECDSNNEPSRGSLEKSFRNEKILSDGNRIIFWNEYS